jgi:hypothetical protein
LKRRNDVNVAPLGLSARDGGRFTRLHDREAKELDAEIREASGKLSADIDALLNLLEMAKAGQIHIALGFPSWPAYICDAVQIAPSNRADRKMLAALMSAEGLGQRAIAAVLSVDQKTVSNDLRSGEEYSSPTTVGLDGKCYQRNPKKPRTPDKPWTDRASAKLDKLMFEAGESDERHDALLALLRAALHTLGVDLVTAES